jgi:hypothetical protein
VYLPRRKGERVILTQPTIPAADRLYLLLLTIVLLGVVGSIVVVLLLGAWRKNLHRERKRELGRQPPGGSRIPGASGIPGAPDDLWRAAAERVRVDTDAGDTRPDADDAADDEDADGPASR